MSHRFNKEDLIDRILRIASAREAIEVYNLEAFDLIERFGQAWGKGGLLFFDPPYCEKGQSLYAHHYKDPDHQEAAEKIRSLQGFGWILTYDDSARIRELYKGFRQLPYQLSYSVSGSRQGRELMIFSPNIVLPQRLKDRSYILSLKS